MGFGKFLLSGRDPLATTLAVLFAIGVASLIIIAIAS